MGDQYDICRRFWPEGGICYVTESVCSISPAQAALGALPPALVEALQDATPAQMQEFADAAVCLSLSPKSEIVFVGEDWYAGYLADEERGDTRAEALRALAEAVNGAKPGEVPDAAE